MAPAGERSADLRYGELTFNGTQMGFPGMSMQLHAFNAAEEAKLCSRPENYGRNPDRSRARSMRDHAGGQFVNMH
jgi:hypothetical protein